MSVRPSPVVVACLALVLGLGAASCSGGVGPGSGAGGHAGSGNAGGPDGGKSGTILDSPPALPVAKACVGQSPGPRMLRRLSAAEFAATIADLFQDPDAPTAAVFNDVTLYGFRIDSGALVIQDLNADQLMTNAETVATWATTQHLSQVAPCSTLDAACAKKVIQSFGRRAYRSSIPDADPRIASYTKLFLGETVFTEAVGVVIATMLQSPYFLYRFELGAAPSGSSKTVSLTPFEVATNLAYLLTGSAPDTTLLDAADKVASGSLTVSGMIDQHAQRLLGQLSTPTSQQGVMGFMRGWLGLDRLYSAVKSDKTFALTNALRDEMATETRSLILDTFNTGGGVSQLLATDHSFLNAELAAFYGLNVPGLGTQFQKVAYGAGAPREGGLLAHASLLTGYARADVSSPTQRGHLVRARLLCEDVPPPPDNLDVTFHPVAMETTTRAHYDVHTLCGGNCHRSMDKIGFAFEHYDAFGRYRTAEGPYPIDATGTVLRGTSDDVELAVDGLAGPQGLATALAANGPMNDKIKACMVRYWSYYAYGSASWDEDACTYDSVTHEAAAGGFALKSVLTALTHAPHFTTRAKGP